MTRTTKSDNYRNDPLYPRITKAVAAILTTGNVVAPVDVLIQMQLLKPEQLKDWRFGRIPYLERVILGNLSKLSRLLRILRIHALGRGLKPSSTVYMKWGKGARHRLRFTKTGDPHLEEAYSLHFVRSVKPAKASPDGSDGPQVSVEQQQPSASDAPSGPDDPGSA